MFLELKLILRLLNEVLTNCLQGFRSEKRLPVLKLQLLSVGEDQRFAETKGDHSDAPDILESVLFVHPAPFIPQTFSSKCHFASPLLFHPVDLSSSDQADF